MPQYAEPFGYAGAAAGGAGGGFLGALGEFLTPLDYPRRAAWNLINAPLQAAGTQDASRLAGMLPGLSGAVLGGLVGGPLGILAGSALGGVLQGAGEAVAPETFAAPAVSDLTGTDDFLPNVLLGALTDPLTFTGGAFGQAAGRNFGRGLEQAALVRGPNYPGGVEKLAEAMKGYTLNPIDSAFVSKVGKEFDYIGPQALRELPPGSQYLGSGVQSDAFLRPASEGGGVVTFTSPNAVFDEMYYGSSSGAGSVPPPRADHPLMNPAVRSIEAGGLRTEVAPLLRTADEVFGPEVNRLSSPAAFEFKQAYNRLADSIDDAGLKSVDLHGGNIGMNAAGDWVVLDRGSIHPLDLSGNPVPRVQDVSGPQPTMIQNALLWALGSDRAVRREIAEKLAAAGGDATGPFNPNLHTQGTRLAPAAVGQADEILRPSSANLPPEFMGRLSDDVGPAGLPAGLPGFSDEIVEAEGLSSLPPVLGGTLPAGVAPSVLQTIGGTAKDFRFAPPGQLTINELLQMLTELPPL